MPFRSVGTCGSLPLRLELDVHELYFREIIEPWTPTGAGTPQGRVQLGVDRPWMFIVNAIGLRGGASTGKHERVPRVVGIHLESSHGEIKGEPDFEPTMGMIVLGL